MRTDIPWLIATNSAQAQENTCETTLPQFIPDLSYLFLHTITTFWFAYLFITGLNRSLTDSLHNISFLLFLHSVGHQYVQTNTENVDCHILNRVLTIRLNNHKNLCSACHLLCFSTISLSSPPSQLCKGNARYLISTTLTKNFSMHVKNK
jgi:hypothetical protein